MFSDKQRYKSILLFITVCQIKKVFHFLLYLKIDLALHSLSEYYNGGVAERLNASVLKTDVLVRVPGVRIPPPPLYSTGTTNGRRA